MKCGSRKKCDPTLNSRVFKKCGYTLEEVLTVACLNERVPLEQIDDDGVLELEEDG